MFFVFFRDVKPDNILLDEQGNVLVPVVWHYYYLHSTNYILNIHRFVCANQSACRLQSTCLIAVSSCSHWSFPMCFVFSKISVLLRYLTCGSHILHLLPSVRILLQTAGCSFWIIIAVTFLQLPHSLSQFQNCCPSEQIWVSCLTPRGDANTRHYGNVTFCSCTNVALLCDRCDE